MTTDISEQGLETLIMRHLTGVGTPSPGNAKAVALHVFVLDLFLSGASREQLDPARPLRGWLSGAARRRRPGGFQRQGQNVHFGTLFADSDRVARRIREDIAPKVAADPAYRNARQNTPNSARIEHTKPSPR